MQVSYADYLAQKNRNNSNTNYNNNNNQNKVTFLGTLLKNDNDMVIVRFPYRDLSDIKLDKCHAVQFPGDQWTKHVRCTGDENCPLCAEGKKVITRFFAKMLVYQPQPDGTLQITPAVWDRPSTFVDVELTEKLRELEEEQMGPLCDNLIKIRRCGAAGSKDTRYSLTIAHNKTVYNSNVYKADFSLLDNINPSRILSKDIAKYLEAFHIESPVLNANETTSHAYDVEKKNSSNPPEATEVGYRSTVGNANLQDSSHTTYSRQTYDTPENANPVAQSDWHQNTPDLTTPPAEQTYERRVNSFNMENREIPEDSDRDRVRPRRTYDF